jgi:hypothetical protein
MSNEWRESSWSYANELLHLLSAKIFLLCFKSLLRAGVSQMTYLTIS